MKTNLEMEIHAECTVYAFLPLLMAMAIFRMATQRRPSHCSSSSWQARTPSRPGNDATALSRTRLIFHDLLVGVRVCVDRRCRFCPHNHRRQLRVPPSSVLFTVHCGHLPLAMGAHSSHPLGSGNTDRANSASGQASKGPPACKHQMDPSF